MSDSTIATIDEEQYLLSRDVWVRRSNNGDPWVFDLGVLREFIRQVVENPLVSPDKGNVYIHDSVSDVRFDVSYSTITHALNLDPDDYLHELEVMGAFETHKQFINRAIESTGPFNPVVVSLHFDEKTAVPYKMRALYVQKVQTSKGQVKPFGVDGWTFSNTKRGLGLSSYDG